MNRPRRVPSAPRLQPGLGRQGRNALSAQPAGEDCDGVRRGSMTIHNRANPGRLGGQLKTLKGQVERPAFAQSSQLSSASELGSFSMLLTFAPIISAALQERPGSDVMKRVRHCWHADHGI